MLKAKASDLSKNWAVTKRHGASYTGGAIQLMSDGNTAACLCSEHVALLDLTTGVVTRILPEDIPGIATEQIINFTVSPVAPVVITCSRNSMMRVWNVTSGECIRQWKTSRLPILSCDCDPSGTLVATGSADRSLMVWDIDHGHATHSFKGHSGSVTCVKFLPCADTVERLVSGAEDGEIRIWDLISQSLTMTIRAHFSAVTAIVFSPDERGYTMLSSARDKIISLWDTRDFELGKTASARATIPTLEVVETLLMLPEVSETETGGKKMRSMHFLSAGDAGIMRKWQLQVTGDKYACGTVAHQTVPRLRTAEEALSGAPADIKSSTSPGSMFSHLLLRNTVAEKAPGEVKSGNKRKRPVSTPTTEIIAVTQDQILSIIRADDLRTTKTIVGHNDDIVDVKFVGKDVIAVATNSEHAQLMDISTFNSTLLYGHTDTIVAMSVSPDRALLCTTSKDKTARVWDIASGSCLVTLEGHTESVSTSAWPMKAGNFVHSKGGVPQGMSGWLVTGSKDRTLKRWDLTAMLRVLPVPRPSSWSAKDAQAAAVKLGKLRSSAAVVAHDKDVNCMSVSPNDKLIATGSQDKSIKLWSPDDLSLVGVLSGHRRGVWAVVFSPVDQILASASGDRTIRLWSVNKEKSFQCLRTLEGHDASVLNVAFVSAGLQLLSTGADGLMKLWNVRETEAVNTFDAHTQKVWALAAAEIEDTKLVVTGGGDSLINIWKDVTGAQAEDEVAATEAALQQQQSLFTAMATRNYSKAVQLTLELDQPGRCGDILGELLEIGPTPAVSMMSTEDLDNKYAREMLTELADMGTEQEGSIKKTISASAATAALAALHISPVLREMGAAAGVKKFTEILSALDDHHIARLLTYVREWNTQSRHGLLAQHVLYVLLQNVPQTRLLRVFGEFRAREAISHAVAGIGAVKRDDSTAAVSADLAPIVNGVEPRTSAAKTSSVADLKAFVAAVLPYSERHMERLDRLLVSTYLVDYTLTSMNVLAPTDGDFLRLGVSSDGRLQRSTTIDRKRRVHEDSDSSEDD